MKLLRNISEKLALFRQSVDFRLLEIRSDFEQRKRRKRPKSAPKPKVEPKKKTASSELSPNGKLLNFRDPRLPAWPSLYYKEKGGVEIYTVVGKCKSLSNLFYGKMVSVSFSAKDIVITGSTSTARRFEALPDVTFRLVQHRDIILGKPALPIERERMQDYREVVMEYGLRSVPVCSIADLEKARLYVRVLQEGYRRSQEVRTSMAMRKPKARKPRKKLE